MPRKRKAKKGSAVPTTASKRRQATRHLSKTVERRPLPAKIIEDGIWKNYTPTLQTLQAFLRQHLDKQIILSSDECNVLRKILKHTKCLVKQKSKESEYMEVATPTFIGQKQLIYYCNGDEQILEYLPLKLEGFLVKTNDALILNMLVLLKEYVLGSSLNNDQRRKNIAKLIGSDEDKLVVDSSADKLEDVDSISSYDSVEGFKIQSSLSSTNLNKMEDVVEADAPPIPSYTVNDAVVAFDVNKKEFRAGKILSLEPNKQCKIVFKKGESSTIPASRVLPYNFKVTLQCPICSMKLPRYTKNARRRDLHVFKHLNREHNQDMETESETKIKGKPVESKSKLNEVQKMLLEKSPRDEKSKVHESAEEKPPSVGVKSRQSKNIESTIQTDCAVSLPSKSSIGNNFEQQQHRHQRKENHRQLYAISKGTAFMQQKYTTSAPVAEPHLDKCLYYDDTDKWNQEVRGQIAAPVMSQYHRVAYGNRAFMHRTYNSLSSENNISVLKYDHAMITQNRGNTLNVYNDTKLIQKILDNELDKLTDTYGVGIMANPKSLLSAIMSILSADYGKAVDASQVTSLEILLHKALKQKKVKLGIDLSWRAFRIGNDGKACGY